MIPLKEWLATDEVRKLKAEPKGRLYSREFFRDPARSVYIDPNVFYAPADGVILYALPEVQPDEPILNIKGRAFTPRDALDDQDYNEPSLVVGIFMTALSVHVNRVPTSGYLVEKHVTPYLFTHNVSMILEEEELLDDGHVDPDDAGYLFANERCVMSVYAAALKTTYYLIQIAERDVDEILNFGDREHYTQGERYGQIRFGSQVDFILPLSKTHDYELIAKPQYVVEAGIDPIVRVNRVPQDGARIPSD